MDKMRALLESMMKRELMNVKMKRTMNIIHLGDMHVMMLDIYQMNVRVSKTIQQI
jgi:hypothetical protein